MDDKQVMDLEGPEPDAAAAGPTAPTAVELCALLNGLKDRITEYHESRLWDRFKKQSNPYELIPAVAEDQPISRSYFKLWEMLTDFEADVLPHGAPVDALFLAEGPGGFVEALASFCQRRARPVRRMHGMTLLPGGGRDQGVPGWRVGARSGLKVIGGADGTGDLCNVDNVRACVAAVGAGSVTLVTADGGFDFSSDFNHQESMCLPLVMAEACVALGVLAPGGAFVLKVFDVFEPRTVAVLQVLVASFARVRMVKPLSSRPANSEKYVVCTGFRASSAPGPARLLMRALRGERDILDLLPIAPGLASRIASFNATFVANQARNITLTFRLADAGASAVGGDDAEQRGHAEAWCRAYGLAVRGAGATRRP